MHAERGLALGCPIISKHWRGSCRPSSKSSQEKKRFHQIVTGNVSTQIVEHVMEDATAISNVA